MDGWMDGKYVLYNVFMVNNVRKFNEAFSV